MVFPNLLEPILGDGETLMDTVAINGDGHEKVVARGAALKDVVLRDFELSLSRFELFFPDSAPRLTKFADFLR